MKNTNGNEKNGLYNALVQDLKDMVQKLKDYGFSEKEITSLLHTEQPLLRLTVSKNYRIYLGKEHKEVHLEPLVRSVYVLFLKHPEGIVFSINEKCARIRGAFVSHFDEDLAKHYYIYGMRGEAKKIALPRDLVVWE